MGAPVLIRIVMSRLRSIRGPTGRGHRWSEQRDRRTMHPALGYDGPRKHLIAEPGR